LFAQHFCVVPWAFRRGRIQVNSAVTPITAWLRTLSSVIRALSGALLPAICCYVLSSFSFPDCVRAAPRAITPRGPLTPDEKNNITVFESSKGSVVYISTSEKVLDYWTLHVQTVPYGTGSGFIWDSAGHVVTNVHVIADASVATVRLSDGKDYPATLVGASRTHDIAVLKIRIPANSAVPIPIGTSHDLQVGQKVYAIGNPFGLDWTLTTGIVSALDRSLTGENGVLIQHLVQTDAAINPGNSGGPLLDSAGRLIGMNTAIYSPSGASAGVGFAVPVDTVNRVVPELIAKGHYTSPSLGVQTDETLSRAVARQLGVEGAAILRVRSGGPAAQAGLRGAHLGRRSAIAGDVIVALNGKPVDSVARLLALLDDCKPGQVVQLTVWRDGKKIRVAVTLRSGEDDN
jgi:S1-C subfamily serine protease